MMPAVLLGFIFAWVVGAEVDDEEVLDASLDEAGVEDGDGEEMESAPGSLIILVGIEEMTGEYITVGRVEVRMVVDVRYML